MKVLISAVIYLLLAVSVQEDQNRYLLVFTALVPAGNMNIITAGTISSQLPFNYYQSHYENRNQVFPSIEDAQSFVSNHTARYFEEGTYTQPWDFQITDITGFYKLQPLWAEKHQNGFHTEYVTTTDKKLIPTYEWSLQESVPIQ